MVTTVITPVATTSAIDNICVLSCHSSRNNLRWMAGRRISMIQPPLPQRNVIS